mmetsp:Transcript_17138/g.15470  ORF Transcript_17138/g.15470 Transcript_17138/m.15470 type:complete len:241 (+) Transcript_17138:84-806(+)
MDSLQIDLTFIPENTRNNCSIVRLTDEMISTFQNLSSNVMKFIQDNRGSILAVVSTTAVVAIIVGSAYYLVPIGFYTTVGVGVKSVASQIYLLMIKFGSFIVANGPTVATVGGTVGVAASMLYFKQWRNEQLERALQRLTDNEVEYAVRLRSDESLEKYICPLLLEPSDFPVKIQEGNHVWYFDQELLLNWYDISKAKGFLLLNPLSKRVLPFLTRDSIVVDAAAREFILAKKAFHRMNL